MGSWRHYNCISMKEALFHANKKALENNRHLTISCQLIDKLNQVAINELFANLHS